MAGTGAHRVRSLVAMCLAALWLAACGAAGQPQAADILLYSGTGTSPNDVKALKRLMGERKLRFATADTRQLNAMGAAELAEYRLLLVPGGNFEVMGNALSPEASATVREAVQGGVNYLGICAGGFIAGASPYNGFNLTGGKRFGFYSISAQGVRKAAVKLAIADGSAAEHYWEDGPEFTGWGDAVARYPDGAPAIAQGEVGRGFAVLVGVHPEAPENWRGRLTFATPAREDNAYAVQLIEAALNRERLPTF